MFLIDFLEEFLIDCKLRGLSKYTIVTYKRNCQLVFRYLEQYYNVSKLEQLTKAHLKSYNLYMLDKGLEAGYINTINKSLKSFFNYLVQEGYTTVNTPKQIPEVKEKIKLYHTFNDEEVQKILRYYEGKNSYISVRNKTILSLFFDTGVRVQELRSIKVSDVYSNFIEVLGKGNKVRALPVSYPLRKQLIKYDRTRYDYVKRVGKHKDPNTIDDYYFLTKSLTQISSNENIQIFIKDVAKKVKVRSIVNPTCHACRHYYAIKSFTSGKADLFTISHTLGHSNINTTKRYLKGITNDQVINKALEFSPLVQLSNDNKPRKRQ